MAGTSLVALVGSSALGCYACCIGRALARPRLRLRYGGTEQKNEIHSLSWRKEVLVVAMKTVVDFIVSRIEASVRAFFCGERCYANVRHVETYE